MSNSELPEGIDAINYCRTSGLYRHQLAEAQHRVNINRTVEIVQWVDDDGKVIDFQQITPNCAADKIVTNQWR